MSCPLFQHVNTRFNFSDNRLVIRLVQVERVDTKLVSYVVIASDSMVRTKLLGVMREALAL